MSRIVASLVSGPCSNSPGVAPRASSSVCPVNRSNGSFTHTVRPRASVIITRFVVRSATNASMSRSPRRAAARRSPRNRGGAKRPDPTTRKPAVIRRGACLMSLIPSQGHRSRRPFIVLVGQFSKQVKAIRPSRTTPPRFDPRQNTRARPVHARRDDWAPPADRNAQSPTEHPEPGTRPGVSAQGTRLTVADDARLPDDTTIGNHLASPPTPAPAPTPPAPTYIRDRHAPPTP